MIAARVMATKKKGGGRATATATKRVMAKSARVAGDKVGNGEGGKSNGNGNKEGDGKKEGKGKGGKRDGDCEEDGEGGKGDGNGNKEGNR